MLNSSAYPYDRRITLAMALYVVLLLALLPVARSAQNPLIQLPCSLAPLVPILYVIWLLAHRIWHSDELEQRTHLIGLGVASGVVGTLGLVGGFLAATKVLSADVAALLLLWIFPIVMFSYGASRWWVARRYGMDGLCENGERMPLYARFLSVAAIIGVAAVWLHWHSNEDVGLLDGMASAFAVAGVLFGLREWMRRRGRPST